MADGARSFQPEDYSLGARLESLLDILAAEGLLVGPRERTAAHMLAVREMEAQATASQGEALAPDVERDVLARLGPVLAPLIARTREERERFARVFDTLYPPDLASPYCPSPPGPPPPDPAQERSRVRRRLVLVLIAALVLAGLIGLAAMFLMARQETDPEAGGGQGQSITEITGTVADAQAPQERSPQTSIRMLERIMEAAQAHGGAPTLREIARATFADPESLAAAGADQPAEVQWSAATYAVRLSELTGLPIDRPLPVYGASATDAPGRLWARLAQALGRIEQPGREPALAVLETAAETSLSATPDRPRAYRILARLPSVYPDPDALLPGPDGAPTPGEIAGRLIDADAEIGEGPGDDIARVLGMAGYPTGAFAHLPWLDPPPRPASQPPPAWLPWLALGLPLAAALRLARSLFLLQPYLRRRPPRVPPTHTELVSEAGMRASVDASQFQRAAQRLRVRTARPSAEIDIPATIAATLRTGGQMIELVQANARARPDYLVLVERLSAGDHDALRMQRLVERLSELVDLDIYHFQFDPGEIEAAGGGRRISIDEAQARHPDHRLIVLGTGAGLLDPVTLEPREAARKLMFWQRRVLLTPIPLAEWSREEYALAEGLAMPVGRATAEGLQFLAELLGLEGGEASPQPDPRGDGLARPLPELLRLRPQRFLFNAEPNPATLNELIVELHNALTPSEFDWFASLAVYPSVQWDLTLFLGVYLPLRDDAAIACDQPDAPPENQKLKVPADSLYSEARLAAITQLPWLKAGRMPNWLRTRLIAELSRSRAAQVRTILGKALESSRLREGATPEEQAVFRIAEDRIRNEPRKEALPPEKLFDDEVLLDFLAGSQRDAFSVPRLPAINGRFLRSFWERLGGPGSLASAAALAFGIAGFVVTPGGELPVVTGAYAPLVLLAIGALLAVALWRPLVAGARLAGWLERIAPGAFAVALATLPAAVSALAPGWPPGLMPAAMVVLCGSGLLLGRWLGERLGLRIHAPALAGARAWIGFAGKSLALGVVCLVLIGISLSASQAVSVLSWSAIAFGVALAGLAAARYAPVNSSVASAGARAERNGRMTPAILRAGLAALPIAAALAFALHVGGAHERAQLMAGADGEAAPIHPERAAISADGEAILTADALGRIRMSGSDGRLIAQAQTTAPVTALAIGGGRESRRAAFADAEGHVFVWPAGGEPQALQDGDEPAQTLGAPAQLAFDAAGELLVAVERADASGRSEARILIGGQADPVPIQLAPPVAVTAAPGSGVWALATLDGGIFVLDARAGAGPDRLVREQGSGTSAPARLLSFAGDTRLRAIGVDGAILEASSNVAEDRSVRWSSLMPAGVSQTLALGPAVGWEQAASIVPPTPPQLQQQLVPDSACAGLSQEFVVYFAWDRSDLTAQSVAVLEQAVANTRGAGCAIQQVTVEGHTDSATDNPEAISARRADAVGQALMTLGVNEDVITTLGRGETDPAKPTADGVREPLNRRVEVQILVGREGGAIRSPAQQSGVETNDADEPAEEYLAPGTLFRDRIAGSPRTPVPEMVVIPAGSFMMGSPESEEGRIDNEGPQRRVTVPAFAAGKYEVTWQEYQACIAARGCEAADDDGFGGGARPVTNVSWEDAQAYVSWLSRETGKTYRLLSEAEWEYAARAGTTTPFSFGSTISTSQANYDGNYTYGYGSRGEYRRMTTPVDTFPANAFGLHDMHGNVWEWVEDCYADNYSSGQPSNGAAFTQGNCSDRVNRGGSWDSGPLDLRSAYRDGDSPALRNYEVGFRVARTL